jgi:hypothetical protein
MITLRVRGELVQLTHVGRGRYRVTSDNARIADAVRTIVWGWRADNPELAAGLRAEPEAAHAVLDVAGPEASIVGNHD